VWRRALAGVRSELIASDYAISFERLPARYAAQGEADQGPALRTFLSEQGTSAETLIVDLLATLDVKAYLLDAGVHETHLHRLRTRTTESP
jgi:protein-tyrosine phosphatase